MTRHPTGTIVPFARPQQPRPRRIRHARARAESVAPCFEDCPPLDDDQLNADWDRLVTFVMQAWCWRDPDSLDAVDRCLRRLRVVVDREWS